MKAKNKKLLSLDDFDFRVLNVQKTNDLFEKKLYHVEIMYQYGDELRLQRVNIEAENPPRLKEKIVEKEKKLLNEGRL